jgi:hypothetical protein
MRAWTKEEGRPPRSFDWAPWTGRSAGLLGPEPARWETEHPRWPSTAVVADRFGSFCNGLRAANLPARIPDHELPRVERVAAAKRLRAAGASLPVIADAIGSSVDTARRYAAAHACAECAGPVAAGGTLCQGCSLLARAERAFTCEEALAAMHAWAAETSEPPRSTDLQTQKLGGATKWTVEHPRLPSTGMVARLFDSFPLVSVAIATLFLGEHLTVSRVAGSAVAIGGVVAVSLARSGATVTSALWIAVGAAVVQGIYHPLIKPLLRDRSGLEVATYVMVAGTIAARGWPRGALVPPRVGLRGRG